MTVTENNLRFASASSLPVALSSSLPEGWVDHPKIPITGRAIWLGVAILLVSIFVAGASIHFRRTQLELTTRFWGADTIRAIQLCPIVTLTFDSDAGKKPVDLSGTPGLGHLRHALLEQKHYLWQTEEALAVDALTTPEAKFATVVFSDPRDDEAVRIPTATIRLELQGGWLGPPDRSHRVQLTDRVKPAVRHFLTVLRNAQQFRSDFRDDK